MSYENIPAGGTAKRIATVATTGDLPVGVSEGSIRYVEADNTLYTYDGATWAAVAGGGGGGVSSVGLALPSSTFTVSGSPVTTSGTLTGTFKTQTANTLMAGPTTGSAAVPAFRALVAADIPTGIPAANIGGGSVDNTEFGYLNGVTSAIQTQIDAKGVGTVTSVGSGTGLTGGPVTTSGSLALANTAVTPGTYGDGTHVGQFTVDQQGRLTAASNVVITGGAASIAIGSPITSSTPGSVLFADSSSQLAQNNSNLFWDDTNNRLGVGTASPQVASHVSVNANSAATVAIVENASAGFSAQARMEFSLGSDTGTTPGKGMVLFSEGSQCGWADYEARRLGFFTGTVPGAASENLTIIDNGKVGVGTINPTTQLQVAGDIGTGNGGILWKTLTGTTASSGSGMTIAHGLTASNIISVSMSVFWGGTEYRQLGAVDAEIPIYGVGWDSTNLNIYFPNLPAWQSQTYRLIIQYVL